MNTGEVVYIIINTTLYFEGLYPSIEINGSSIFPWININWHPACQILEHP